MRIAVDAMGGDFAPQEVVEGAVEAAAALGVEILLVGDRRQVAPLCRGARGVELVHAPEVIPMGAAPVEALRRSPDSSIAVAIRLVKEGHADAVVSAGSTGAAMAAALLEWGRVKGIERPAIGTLLPTQQGACILVDAGANVDCRPSHLAHFALMGSSYARLVLGIERPRVGLLNIGEEETKGSGVVLEAHARLKALHEAGRIHFAGNVEGRDILAGKADVVVCDGFVGNVVLKFAEGMARALFELIKQAVRRGARSRVGGLLIQPALEDLWRRLDYTEYGGAPLLGVQGVCIISHGASNARAIRNAIRVAKASAEQGIVREIASLVAAPAV